MARLGVYVSTLSWCKLYEPSHSRRRRILFAIDEIMLNKRCRKIDEKSENHDKNTNTRIPKKKEIKIKAKTFATEPLLCHTGTTTHINNINKWISLMLGESVTMLLAPWSFLHKYFPHWIHLAATNPEQAFAHDAPLYFMGEKIRSK